MQVKFERLVMPSDGISIGKMRAVEPELFTTLELGRSDLPEGLAIHYWERVLAEKAFANSAGHVDPWPRVERSEIVGILARAYMTFGIAGGTQEANQLIRDLERDAAKQALRKGV